MLDQMGGASTPPGTWGILSSFRAATNGETEFAPSKELEPVWTKSCGEGAGGRLRVGGLPRSSAFQFLMNSETSQPD